MIYTAADFDGQQAADYTLLIGAGNITNTLAVVDQAQQLKFAADYDPSAPGAEVTALLDFNFGTVKLALFDSLYTLIPTEVYDEQHHNTYLQYLPFDGVGTTHVSDVAPLGVKLLHQTSRVGLEAIEGRFPAALHYPFVQPLLNAVAAHGMQATGPLLVIERHLPWVTISIFDKGRFLYCHDFESINIEDFNYYLLAVVDRFGLSEHHPVALLAGDIDLNDAYYERVREYVETVTLADSGALTGIGIPSDMQPHQHRFLTILGLHRCV